MCWSIIAVCWISIIIIIAHLFTPATYSWKENTISELAAQKYKNRWVMQVGFIGFGILVLAGYLINFQMTILNWYTSLPIMIYAASISASGIFCTKPFIEEEVDFSNRQFRIHSLFAQMAGIAFTVAILIYFIISWITWVWIIHLIALVFVIGMSMSFGNVKKGKGIVQRILWSGSFLWLLFLYLI